MEYTNKRDCEKNGLVRDEYGGYRKLNTLEKYERKGWLNYGNKYIGSNEKLSAGLRFYCDFRRGHIETMTAIDWTKDRVDGGNQRDLSPSTWDARTRFIKALKAISSIYLPVVARVVLDDKPLSIPKLDSAQYNHDLEIAKEHLCCGLDELSIHYGVKPVRPMRMQAFCEVEFWDNIGEYISKIGA